MPKVKGKTFGYSKSGKQEKGSKGKPLKKPSKKY